MQAMADDGQPQGAYCLAFLMHSLHIPAGRNLGIFAPVLALNVAYVGFANHAYSLARDGVLRPNEMAAAYLLCAILGSAVWVITASAAVATFSPESEQHALSWRPLIAETLRGSLKAAGPVATVVDANILSLVTRAGGAVALFLLQDLIMSNCCYLTLQLIDLLVALRAAHHLLQAYVRAVSSVAVVVSVSSQSQPAAACHGLAALRRAWRLSRENATRTAALVATEGVLAGAISWCYESAVEHAFEHEYSWYAYVLLSGAALTFSVCVAAAFYYQCPQSADADAPAAARGGGWRQPWTTGKEWFGSCTSQCSSFLRDIMQGRRSTRQLLATMESKIRCWSLEMLSFASRHPLELYVLAAAICAWLSTPTEIITFVFGQNRLLSYRSSLRSTYRATLNPTEGRICPKPHVGRFNPLSTWGGGYRNEPSNNVAIIHQQRRVLQTRFSP